MPAGCGARIVKQREEVSMASERNTERNTGGKDHPQLVVMLTYQDRTVEDAYRIFDACKNTKTEYWGFKEEPMPLEQMKELYAYMRSCRKTTSLEVVAYTEDECLQGARMAEACEVDYLMGTVYFDSVNELCRSAGIRYMPFVGKVSGRPSILEGTAREMIEEAERYLEKGVYGFDLLGYRYTGDAPQLNRMFVSAMSAKNVPVCVAGSVNSFQRLDEIRETNPWSYTIGGAFFEHRFGDGFAEQINRVCDYMAGSSEKKL